MDRHCGVWFYPNSRSQPMMVTCIAYLRKHQVICISSNPRPARRTIHMVCIYPTPSCYISKPYLILTFLAAVRSPPPPPIYHPTHPCPKIFQEINDLVTAAQSTDQTDFLSALIANDNSELVAELLADMDASDAATLVTNMGLSDAATLVASMGCKRCRNACY